jgi:hypothetical protein
MKKYIILFFVLFAGSANIAFSIDWPLYTVVFNMVPEGYNIPLVGAVNVAQGKHAGIQIGFLNLTCRNFTGASIGYVNITIENTTGLQLGFVNITKTIRGVQFGFINYADTINSGVPFGFLSIVKNGGYRVIETGVTGTAVANIAFKIGVEKLYTTYLVSYNPKNEGKSGFAFGMGLGSIINFNKLFFINPELNYTTTFDLFHQQLISLDMLLGFNIGSHFSIVAGPECTWHITDTSFTEPLFRFYGGEINNENRYLVGAKIAIRYRL